MSDQPQTIPADSPRRPESKPAAATQLSSCARKQLRTLLVLTAVLLCCFVKPLYGLIGFALHSDLFSHVLLIPLISGYLVWINRQSLPAPSKAHRRYAIIPALAGLASLLLWLGAVHSTQDYLAWAALSFLVFFVAACCFCLGPDTLRAVAFPLSFLIFAIPFPVVLVDWIEAFLQHSSALAADFLFSITGMSFLRNGLLFQLPGIRLEVAPECSGIHSTLVLFITSLVAGQLFLRKFSNRALLVAAVIPLGIVRNAFRIWTIGELCVHVSPDMIDSAIHRRGGPLFFAISLVPLFLLLYYQRRSELRTKPSFP
jgi:exosortase C (VPDSG-CTERM-specific)